MKLKIAVTAAALVVVAILIWHPARPPVVQSIVTVPTEQTSPDRGRDLQWAGRSRLARPSDDNDLVVYVAGAVRKPGLYHLHAGDRDAKAVALAGGFQNVADAAGVNLALRATDGDEIYVPTVGEAYHSQSAQRRGRRHARTPPAASVDLNAAGAAELAAVPGIGRAIAQRIVELREREGNFATLDELLDVAGMTRSRLERARQYLRSP